MMNKKIINMKSEMKTLSHANGHICPEIDNYDKLDETNNVEFNYEDDISDIDYDSDTMENSYRQNTPNRSTKPVRRLEDDDDEEEFSDDDDDDDCSEEDRKIEHSIYIKLQNKQYASALEGLSVLNGKLNWLEKAAINDESSFVDEKDYPNISIEEPKNSLKRIASGNRSRFYPAKHITVKIGNTTFIGLKDVEQVQIKKLCNAIRDGKECRFGDRCKFLHKLSPSKKPNCKYDVKCGNRKCTFVHPNGKIEKATNVNTELRNAKSGREHSSQARRAIRPRPTNSNKSLSPNSNKINENQDTKHETPGLPGVIMFETSSFRKIWLCKNIFKISTTAGFLYDSIKIEETGTCRFGNNCVYAHSSEEVRQHLESCKFKEECKGVKITQIKKEDKKVRRYENNPETRKCCRLHPKERVIDFIKRIQINNVEGHDNKM